jgi:hypothetical protein
MNERIKKLADQCYSKYGVQVDPVKFAELIWEEAYQKGFDAGAEHVRTREL